MKSSSGAHYISLDHIRALAAFMVFTWHFTHNVYGVPVPFSFTPALFPLALFDEGHTGVSLFMALSGYLFAKLLEGKSVNYIAFTANRILRLLPLLALTVSVEMAFRIFHGGSVYPVICNIIKGCVFPTLPNGGWSVTTEFHFYLLLPLFVAMFRKSKFLPAAVIALAIALRIYLYQRNGGVQILSYFTIVGRVDQFTLGMIMYHFRNLVARRTILPVAVMISFTAFYWYFDFLGGFCAYPSYSSPSPLWIFMPTIEGLGYAVLISWYDNSFEHSRGRVSRLVGAIGQYSYSIYLLHFFLVFSAAKFVHEHIMNISNFYLAFCWSFVCFLLMVPIGYLSYRFIESPFLRMRKPYLIPRKSAEL